MRHDPRRSTQSTPYTPCLFTRGFPDGRPAPCALQSTPYHRVRWSTGGADGARHLRRCPAPGGAPPAAHSAALRTRLALGTIRAAFSAAVRSTSRRRLVYVSDVSLMVEWRNVSLMVWMSAPPA